MVFLAPTEMQAVESFSSSFQNSNVVLIHITLDTVAEDLLSLGLLTSDIPNYTALVGANQDFLLAYQMEQMRVIADQAVPRVDFLGLAQQSQRSKKATCKAPA